MYNQGRAVIKKQVSFSNGLLDLVFSSFLSGGITGSLIAFASAPMEFIKVQRQLHTLKAHRTGIQISVLSTSATTIEWFKFVFRQKGLGGLYNGFNLHLARDFFGTAYYFCAYETFKYLASPNGEKTSPWIHLLGGGVAGTTVWLMVFPIDLCKSIMQRDALNPNPKFKSVLEFIKLRYERKGWRGFYVGLQPQLIRSFPVHAVNFMVYEQMLRVIDRFTRSVS